jgi:Mrp family chromosome partitioning ATPase
MEHVPSKDRFWTVAPAADRIFVHVRNDPDLSDIELDFDYGLVDSPSSRAVAKFSGASRSGHAVVWVTAATQLDGNWVVTHSLHWDD